jgi:hypothetical protein
MWGESRGVGDGAAFGFALPLVATQPGVPAAPLVLSSVAPGDREEEFARRIRSLV